MINLDTSGVGREIFETEKAKRVTFAVVAWTWDYLKRLKHTKIVFVLFVVLKRWVVKTRVAGCEGPLIFRNTGKAPRLRFAFFYWTPISSKHHFILDTRSITLDVHLFFFLRVGSQTFFYEFLVLQLIQWLPKSDVLIFTQYSIQLYSCVFTR